MIPLRIIAILLALPLVAAAQGPAKDGRKFAFLVGVNGYSDPNLSALRYAEKDIAELGDTLKAAGFQSEVLLGSSKGPAEATRENILLRFQALLKQVKKTDLLLVGLSGHGQQLVLNINGAQRQLPFFCPKDANPQDPNTLLSITGMLEDVTKNGGKTNLFLIDACRNVDGPGGINARSMPSLDLGIAAFFACSDRQRAMETDKAGGGHGVFFHFVLEGLKGAPGATDADGNVTWENLVPYVKKEVRTKSAEWFTQMKAEERQVPHAVTNLAADPVLAVPGLEVQLAADVKAVMELNRTARGTEEFFLQTAPRRITAWKRAAEAGVANGMFLYGRCLLHATQVNKNTPQALAYYRKAAELGHTEALFHLGLYLHSAAGADRNAEQAHQYFLQLARNGHVAAMNMLGVDCRDGIGTARNSEEALKWFEKASVGGNRNAMFNLGNCHRLGTGTKIDETKSIEWFLRAAELGHAIAANNAAVAYDFGKGVKQDVRKAVDLYRKAADNGNALAMRNLGNMYANGKDDVIKKDDKIASQWYMKASIAGDPPAMGTLARRYEKALGLPQSDAKALEWFTKGAGLGNEDCQYNLGRCQLYGIGMEKNEAQGLETFRVGAERGYAPAMNSYGNCFQLGHGTAKNFETANIWFQRAAVKGNTFAMRSLAYNLDHGQGIGKNEIEATTWYQKAALAGDAAAMNSYALRLQTGTGVNKNPEESFNWFKKAAEAGNVYALRNTGLAYHHGRGVGVDTAEAAKWYRKCITAATNANIPDQVEKCKKHLADIGEKP